MNILVTGSSGYIGSIYKVRSGFKVGEYDGDIRSFEHLDSHFARNKYDGVVHLAALSNIPDSYKHPDLCYENNVIGTKNILECMVKYNVRNIVFSSSCAVYGPLNEFRGLREDDFLNPISPYAKSKLEGERLIRKYSEHGINSCILRLFNVAGADLHNDIGECHEPETHLIPLVIHGLMGLEDFKINGKDYNTPDGTCLRDFVHVLDVCDAINSALVYLSISKRSLLLNIGNGESYSVLDIFGRVKYALRSDKVPEFIPCRQGDSPVLMSDISAARDSIGFNPARPIEEIIKDAITWELKKMLL